MIKTVSPDSIERELRDVWEQMAHPSTGESQQAVVRACVLNLVIYSPDKNDESSLTQTVAETSTNHPGRILILSGANPSDNPPEIDASVNALCHFQPGGRKQVCCEQILIRSTTEGMRLVPGIVLPLLIPDLPVILWWRTNLDLKHPLFEDLLDASTRIVFDSSQWQRSIGDLADFIAHEKQWTAFSDFNWARLTSWRVLISGFFDLPDCRQCLKEIERVEIEYAGDSLPAEVHLLIGWLASRLKWEMTSAQETAFTFQSGNHRIQTDVRRLQTGLPGVHSIKIHIGGASHPYVEVRRAEDRLHLDHSFAGTAAATNPIRLPDPSESHILSGELEIAGHDRVYEDAISYFAKR